MVLIVVTMVVMMMPPVWARRVGRLASNAPPGCLESGLATVHAPHCVPPLLCVFPRSPLLLLVLFC